MILTVDFFLKSLVVSILAVDGNVTTRTRIVRMAKKSGSWNGHTRIGAGWKKAREAFVVKSWSRRFLCVITYGLERQGAATRYSFQGVIELSGQQTREHKGRVCRSSLIQGDCPLLGGDPISNSGRSAYNVFQHSCRPAAEARSHSNRRSTTVLGAR